MRNKLMLKQMIKEAGINEDLTMKTNIERAST